MRTVKIFLLFVILVTLAVSPLQWHYGFFRESRLKGIFALEPAPDVKFFTWHRWFTGEFQEQFTKRLNDHFGLRNTLIRLNNQVDYTLFRTIHAKGFMEGKKGYLFEEDYIYEYNGNYFIGQAAIDKKLTRLKNVCDSLQAYGVPLLLIYEPGKASFYPEHIPRHYRPDANLPNNYTYYLQRSAELGLPFADLNRWFMQMKDTARFPLFPKYGMHWSLYGVPKAVDTLAKLVERTTGKDLPDFRISQVIPCNIPVGTDNDIGELLNLVCDLPETPGAYPRIVFEQTPPRTVNALIIADSYYISIAEAYGRKLFRNQDYWYYNKKVYPHQNHVPPPYVDKSNLREKLIQYDVILLMTSEINLHCGFWDFADEAYRAFHPQMQDPHLYRIENNIRNEREWFQFLANRARLEKMPLEKMIRSNAEYFFYTYYNELENKGYWDTIQYITMNIRNNAEWYGNIVKTAETQQMPLDTALKLNAVYIYDQTKKKP